MLVYYAYSFCSPASFFFQVLGRWNPIDIWNPVVTKTEQTHYGPWQSQYHTVQPKGPPNAGPWKLTQWSPQTVAAGADDSLRALGEMLRSYLLHSSAISLAISLAIWQVWWVWPGAISVQTFLAFQPALSAEQCHWLSRFEVTIAWANLPREWT